MDREQVEAQTRDRCLDPDLGRVEPVLQLPAVEHQLQCADAEAQHRKAEAVERLAPHSAGLADEDEDAERAQCADRQVDVKAPAPAEIIG